MRRFLSHSLTKYVVVGVGSLLVDYGLLIVLFRFVRLDLVVSTTIAFIVGLSVNFILNKYWSFQAARGMRKSAQQASLYALLVIFNLIFTNIFISVLDGRAGVGPEVSKPIATLLITLWNYLLYRTVIFRGTVTKGDIVN